MNFVFKIMIYMQTTRCPADRPVQWSLLKRTANCNIISIFPGFVYWKCRKNGEFPLEMQKEWRIAPVKRWTSIETWPIILTFEVIDGWNAITKRIYIWNYVVDFGSFLQTFPNYYVLGPNIEFFAAHGVRGIFQVRILSLLLFVFIFLTFYSLLFISFLKTKLALPSNCKIIGH